MADYEYYALYKPYGVLSQFTQEQPGDITLGDLHPFSKDVYPAGRLDKDSEGLLILTNDPTLNAELLSPRSGKTKTYHVQLEGNIDESATGQLMSGVTIRVGKKDYRTKPCRVKTIGMPENLPDRHPPVRFRASIPTNWIEISIGEGKNRQIRKMCASVGFPVLRLIRIAIGNYNLPELIPGKVWNIRRSDLIRRFNAR